MRLKTLIAILLVAAGTLGLVYRGFDYTRHTHEARLGPFHVSVTQRDRVDVPAWASVLLIALGVAILVVKRSD